MHPWLHDYNTVRPHAALNEKQFLSRLLKGNVLDSSI
jgi:transposase InsO family protein